MEISSKINKTFEHPETIRRKGLKGDAAKEIIGFSRVIGILKYHARLVGYPELECRTMRFLIYARVWQKNPIFYIYDLKIILMRLNLLYDEDMHLFSPYIPLVREYRPVTFTHVLNAIGRTTGEEKEEATKFINMLMSKCWREKDETTRED